MPQVTVTLVWKIWNFPTWLWGLHISAVLAQSPAVPDVLQQREKTQWHRPSTATETGNAGPIFSIKKHLLHQPLKHTWSIAQAKGHTIPLEKTKRGTKYSFWFVLFHDWNLIIPTRQVLCCKPLSTRDGIKRQFWIVGKHLSSSSPSVAGSPRTI